MSYRSTRIRLAEITGLVREQAGFQNLHRRNSLFYKTQRGARVGDLFMSLISTCQLSDVNPFEYLTALLRNFDQLVREPAQWMAVELL